MQTGFTRPLDILMTMSHTTSPAVKCFSTCGVIGSTRGLCIRLVHVRQALAAGILVVPPVMPLVWFILELVDSASVEVLGLF